MVIGYHARHQPARQEQLECLGQLDTSRTGLNRQPSDFQTNALTSCRLNVAQYSMLASTITGLYIASPNPVIFCYHLIRHGCVVGF